MIILIHDTGDEWNQRIEIIEFNEESSMIKFVNDENIGTNVLACYSVHKEIKIEPFEKVTEYRIKD